MNNKSLKLKALEKTLRLMSSLVLKKYRPKVIAITGSVGKTSTKEAVFTVLASFYRVRKSEKNYNNEIGVPLTILGVDSGGRSVWSWLRVISGGLSLILIPHKYPEILILEMGADRPGDISYLTSFIKPSISIITDISSSHLEFFETIEGVFNEKIILVRELEEKGIAILNVDNPHLHKFQKQFSGKNIKLVGFGYSEEADVRSTDVMLNYVGDNSGGKEIRGISFKLNYKGTSIPVRLNNVLARHSVYAAMAGIAVGIEMGLNLVEIGTALESYSLPAGRMTLIRGIKKSFIIDDTYNASPVSTVAALDVLGETKSLRKIAVLGDMLELGVNTEPGHREVAKKFQKIKGEIFIAVGARMQFAVEELKKHNFPENNIFSFRDPMSAGIHLQKIIQPGDLILVKGSQGMRMEKIVEEIMAEPRHVREYLCRQDKKWREKKWKEV